MSTDTETCLRCGKDRLPSWWYKPGFEWLGHMVCEPKETDGHVSR